MGDREGFTYDNPGKSYLGLLRLQQQQQQQGGGGGRENTNANATVTLSPATADTNFSNFDDWKTDSLQHMAVLLNGSSAPQYRFVLRRMPSLHGMRFCLHPSKCMQYR